MTTGTVTIGTARPFGAGAEATRWDAAGIRRAMARLGKISVHDPRVRLPGSDKIMDAMAQGRSMVWEESGRTFRAQAWCAGPYVRSYWYLVYSKCAYFPGELRLVQTDAEGRAWLHDAHSYNAQGKRAHRHDGSACYGSGISGAGCLGCKRGQIAGYIGKRVRVALKCEMYGRTLRWGVLRELAENGYAVFDDFRDSAGLGGYCGRTEGVREPVADILEIQAA